MAQENKYIADIVNKRAWILLLFLLLAMCAFIFWDFLTFQKLYLFSDIGSDTLNSRYPDKLHKAHYYATEGRPMKWSFYVGLGQNMFEGWSFHPMDLVNYILSSLSIEKRIIYLEIFKVVACGMLFYIYLGCHRLTNLSKIIASLCYAFSGYMILGSTWYVHTRLLFDFTFLLLCCEYLVQNKRRKWLLPIAIYFIGLNPQMYYFGVFMFIYGLGRIWEERDFTVQKQFKFTLQFALFGLLGLLLLAPEINSQIQRYMDSPRMSGSAAAFDDLAATPFLFFERPMHYFTAFLRLFSNDILGTGDAYRGWVNYLEAPSFYIGLLTLILAPLSWFLLRRVQKIFYLVMLGFWVFLVIFPFGRYAFYAFAGDYYKSAFSIFVPFSLLFVAVQVLDKMLRYQQFSIGLLWSSIFTWIVGLGCAYVLGGEFIEMRIWWIVIGSLLAYGVLLTGIRLRKTGGIASKLLLIFVVLELGFWATQTLEPRKVIRSDRFEKRLGYNDYTVDVLKFLKEKDDGFYRIEKYYSSSLADHKSLNDAKAQYFYGTSNYASFNQGYYIRFLQSLEVIGQRGIDARWVIGLRQRPLLQTLCGVKYQLYRSNQEKSKDDTFSTTIKRFGDVTLKANRYVLPLGFSYRQYIAQADFDLLNSEQKDKALLQAVVLDKEQIAQYPHLIPLKDFENLPSLNDTSWQEYYQKEDTLIISHHSQNEIVGTIELAHPQLLFFSIPYDKNWFLWDNGEKREMDKVNIGFMGIWLDKGKHELKLKFEPSWL